jgi:enediyne polyketide synthase
VAQPAVVTASLAGLKVLEDLGLGASAAIGHSLGELTALHWAGVFDTETLLRIARVRGAAMAELGSPTGAMLAIAAPWQQVQGLLGAEALAIVGFNSPRQTVVAGDAAAVGRLAGRAETAGWRTAVLPVSHAFHTPLVAAATPVLADHLAREHFGRLERPVVSTILGAPLAGDEDLRALLCRQVTSPVRFDSALAALLGRDPARWNSCAPLPDTPKPGPEHARPVDLLIEVGPGAVLSGLVRDMTEVPVVSLDAGGASLRGLLQALGAAFALGAPVRPAALFNDRFTRPFALDWKPRFFVNPCELAPVLEEAVEAVAAGVPPAVEGGILPPGPSSGITEALEPTTPLPPGKMPGSAVAGAGETPAATHPLELIRQLVAARTELPRAAIQDDHRMLSDLHLNSITVGQLVSEAARRLGLPRIVGLTEFANASVTEVARALEELKRTGGTATPDDKRQPPPGVDAWIESFAMELVEAKRPLRESQTGDRSAAVLSRSSLASLEDVRDFPIRQLCSSAAAGDSRAPAGWQVFAPQDHPLAGPLRDRLAVAGGGGVLVCLPEKPGEDHIAMLLDAARAALAMECPQRFVLVQHGRGGGGFARTLHLETPGLTTCVVNVPTAQPEAVEWVLAEAMSAAGFTEAVYDGEGRRWEPKLKWVSFESASETGNLLSIPSSSSSFSSSDSRSDIGSRTKDEDKSGRAFPIGPHDVLLVTGGGKGIAAECALALARATGARLALLGRSSPGADKELADNLARIAVAGVTCCYVRADVTDAPAVRAAIAQAEKELGPVTALLHGAGTNRPQLIEALDEAAFRRTVAPKVQGARNVLSALNTGRLKLFVTFGSIIARAGLRGEADYATANEWLTALTEEFQATHPACRCLAPEWSVWSGVGMGERLGRVDSLLQQGITPIPPDEGARILVELVRRPLPAVAVVVTGRFGEAPTLKLEQPELPLLRFLEQPGVFYPGVELIADAVLSAETDPYLEDHVYHGEQLFPAVMGLEAMAQVAMALTGSADPPDFADVKFNRPVVVPRGGKVTIRVAALRRRTGDIEVVLRSEESGFQADHFQATCRFEPQDQNRRRAEALASLTAVPEGEPSPPASAAALAEFKSARVPLEPARDLYGELLFHTGRFRRVLNYRLLRARECLVQVEPDMDSAWFGQFLPPDRVLGDTGVRDAAIHAIQACIPHARLLPVGVKRVALGRLPCLRERVQATGRVPELLLHAREQCRDGDIFHYDLELLGEDGTLFEKWEGLCLRKVEDLPRRECWSESLLGPYVERRLEELLPHARVAVVLERGAHADQAIQLALGSTAKWHRRPDGKPEAAGMTAVSAAHTGGLVLAVSGQAPIGCDLELVAARPPETWRDLLGVERFRLAELLAGEAGEDFKAAATRVWTAIECLKKAGAMVGAPLVLGAICRDGWILLGSGAQAIATYLAPVREFAAPLAIGVLTGSSQVSG